MKGRTSNACQISTLWERLEWEMGYMTIVEVVVDNKFGKSGI